MNWCVYSLTEDGQSILVSRCSKYTLSLLLWTALWPTNISLFVAEQQAIFVIGWCSYIDDVHNWTANSFCWYWPDIYRSEDTQCSRCGFCSHEGLIFSIRHALWSLHQVRYCFKMLLVYYVKTKLALLVTLSHLFTTVKHRLGLANSQKISAYIFLVP